MLSGKKLTGKSQKLITPKASYRKQINPLNEDYYVDPQRTSSRILPSHRKISSSRKYSSKIKRRSRTQASDTHQGSYQSNSTVKPKEPYLKGV